ncbi:MAG: threonine/serine ThrE exporter family protein [Mycobacterium sp.]
MKRHHRIIEALRKSPPVALGQADRHDPQEIAAMLREIGIALIEVSQPTPQVEARLMQIAARYTSEPVRVVALPTALMIQIGDNGYQIEGSTRSSLQLDAAGRIDDIAGLASAGAITPSEAVAAIQAARTMAPRFGSIATIGGYALTTIGFGMVINPTWSALPAYLILGLVVGAIVQASRPFPSLTPILPTLAAMAVTILAVKFLDAAANDGLLRVISPALVATLPGMSLTIGAMELASSQIVSGSSRLIYGMSQLGMLLFGVAIGLHIAGWVDAPAQSTLMGDWSLYVAIVVVSLGLYVYLSAPPGSLFWLMASIAVALLAQAAAGRVMSASHSGFVGAFLSVPFAMLATRIKTSPPPIVMLLAAFWSLVPGALSFVAVGQVAAGDDGGAGLGATSLAATGAAILSIALGTLVGWAVFYTIDSRMPWSNESVHQR